MAIGVREFRGKEVASVMCVLAQLRISVFREYPYLYDGSLGYELEYLARYERHHDGIVLGVYDGLSLIGAATGLPLSCELEGIRMPFLGDEFRDESIYYVGELIFVPAYRGRGLGSRTLGQLEDRIVATGAYSLVTLCTVQRATDDPRQPPGYRSPEPIWQRAGFSKRGDLVAHIAWQELGEEAQTMKPLTFWVKRLSWP